MHSTPREKRKAWMRRSRRAAEGHGYRTIKVPLGADPLTGQEFFRTYILKADGRTVVDTGDLTPGGQRKFKIVKKESAL